VPSALLQNNFAGGTAVRGAIRQLGRDAQRLCAYFPLPET
jgi:hypothetical protein